MSVKLMMRSSVAALALAMASLPALAQSDFPKPEQQSGQFRISSAERGQPIFSGSTVIFSGSGFAPGQQITLQRGTDILTGDAPLEADAEGNLRFSLDLPENAATGTHPVVVLGQNPSTTELVDLKISPKLGRFGAENYDITAVKSPAPGLYQLAYSKSENALFLTATDFRSQSATILKLDPETLNVMAKAAPVPFSEDLKSGAGGRFADAPVAAFGIGLDEARGYVWVTNTASNSVAVYSAKDLSLVKQFPQDATYHSREVEIDAAHDRVYVTSSATAKIHVFDAESLEYAELIEIKSTLRGERFYVMNLALDAERHRLYATSRATSELAVINTETGAVEKVFALPGAIHATGVDVDQKSGLVYVAGQGSDDVMIVDAEAGKVLHDVEVGAGALSVAFDPAQDLAWVANRGAGTLGAVTPEGELAVNLDLGSYPNHAVVVDGTIYAVNKSFGPEDEKGDLITKIVPKAE